MKNLLLTFLGFPCEWEVVFLFLFSRYLLLIYLVYIWYLLVLSCMEYVELLRNVDCFSPVWGVFSHYFFDYIFFSFLYFCEKSFLSSHVAVLWFSIFSEAGDMYSLFFLCVLQIVQSLSIYIQVSDISANLYYIYCWVPGMNFSSWLSYFSAPKFLLFKIIFISYWYCIFDRIFLLFTFKKINLYLAEPGLHCFVGFSRVVAHRSYSLLQWPLFVVGHGLSSYSSQALEHRIGHYSVWV